MFKKYFLIFCFFFFAFLIPAPIQAQETPKIYFFYGDGCPHCAAEESLLDQLEKEGAADILRYEVWRNQENVDFLKRISAVEKIDFSGVPLTIVGEKQFVGFYNAEITGAKIRAAVEDCQDFGCRDLVAEAIKKSSLTEEKINPPTPARNASLAIVGGPLIQGGRISLPFFGEIDPSSVSLPVFTALVAGVDGFNPCAMWVLVFLIGLLLGMEDRKKMAILGSAFIFSSAAVYFLFLSAWLNLFLFIGFIFWIRFGIALVALLSGGYHLREWWVNRDGVCKVTGNEKRRVIFDRLKSIIQKEKFIISLVGVIVLAAAVNLVELVCSAGLPAVYTQVLSLANLPSWQYYAYLLLYIFIFMLDDLVVFFLAMSTLEIKAVGARYSRWSGLVGGALLLLVGILLLFKPGWLMFG